MNEPESLAPGTFTRKLAAILFTDMVGYTAVMQHDEMLAINMQKRHQAVVDEFVNKYGGEVKNDMGDGSMSILPSAYQVIKCAMDIQNELQHGDPHINIRVGIHIADILLEKSGKVHGDGINIASRIETLGVAGAILFSQEVYNKIKNHPEFVIKKVGTYPFKNVDEPMNIYAIANAGFNIPTESQALAAGKLKKNQASRSVFKPSTILYILFLFIAAIAGYILFSKKTTLDQVVQLPANNNPPITEKIWKGKIVNANLVPARGITLEIEGKLVDTTNDLGEFEFAFPEKYTNQKVNIILNKGKADEFRPDIIRLNDENISLLKINRK